jgi:streptogramin lyase
MRIVPSTIALLAALAVTPVSAQVQGVDLNGQYRCVAQCLGPPGSFAFITQNGWELNVINDAGEPSRGWVDYPGRIWIREANQGAIYSADGFTIQFDRGTIWQRAPLVPPPRR